MIFKGEIKRASGRADVTDFESNCETILFTTQSSILQLIACYDQAYQQYLQALQSSKETRTLVREKQRQRQRQRQHSAWLDANHNECYNNNNNNIDHSIESDASGSDPRSHMLSAIASSSLSSSLSLRSRSSHLLSTNVPRPLTSTHTSNSTMLRPSTASVISHQRPLPAHRVQLLLCTNWGDHCLFGLTAVAAIDQNMNEITWATAPEIYLGEIDPVTSMLHRVCPGNHPGGCPGPDCAMNVNDGLEYEGAVYLGESAAQYRESTDPTHMFQVTKPLASQRGSVVLDFSLPSMMTSSSSSSRSTCCWLKALRLWNYNADEREHDRSCGVKQMIICLDNKRTNEVIVRKAPGNAQFDYSQLISLQSTATNHTMSNGMHSLDHSDAASWFQSRHSAADIGGVKDANEIVDNDNEGGAAGGGGGGEEDSFDSNQLNSLMMMKMTTNHSNSNSKSSHNNTMIIYSNDHQSESKQNQQQQQQSIQSTMRRSFSMTSFTSTNSASNPIATSAAVNAVGATPISVSATTTTTTTSNLHANADANTDTDTDTKRCMDSVAWTPSISRSVAPSNTTTYSNTASNTTANTMRRCPIAQQYDPPLLPRGSLVTFVLHSTQGDPHYIGLNGLELLDEFGSVICISRDMVHATPCSDLNDLQEVQQRGGDRRGLHNLCTRPFDTYNDHHMWLTLFATECDLQQVDREEDREEEDETDDREVTVNRVYILFDLPVTISCVRIYNYAKTPARGLRDFDVSAVAYILPYITIYYVLCYSQLYYS
jgi:hypothetical protein